MASPPSFATLFRNQERQIPVAQNSFDYPADDAANVPGSAGGLASGPLMDEPEPFGLDRRGSASSLASRGGRGGGGGSGSAGASASAGRGSHTRTSSATSGAAPLRQDSFPHEPTQTTLIQTAPLPGQYVAPAGVDGAYAFMPSSAGLGAGPSYPGHGGHAPWLPQDTAQFVTMPHAMQPHGTSPLHSAPLTTADYSYNGTPGDYSFAGSSYMGAATGDAPATAPGGWGMDFLEHHSDSASASHSRRSSFNGGFDARPDFERALTPAEQEQISEELERIIAASVGGTPSGSRVASPFGVVDSSLQQQQQQAPASFSPGHQHHDSLSSNRSPSPYLSSVSPGTQGRGVSPSPPVHPFHRASSSSLSGSPFTNKPQSPPALVIPNQHSPSPSLPPIITSQPAGPPPPSQDPPRPQPGLGHAHVAQPQASTSSNTLFPPANPALEHLTGMAGISPIAPSADGPMIYIQPSTPISGLQSHRGIFDAALQRAHAQRAAAGGAGQAGHAGDDGLPRAASLLAGQAPPPPPLDAAQLQAIGQYAQLSQPGPFSSATDANAFLRDAQAWAQSLDLDALRPASSHRPRAKSESFTTGAPDFDRQAMLQLLGSHMAGIGGFSADIQQALLQQQQQQQMQQQQQWQTTVNAWRQNQLAADGPTLDPRHLPGVLPEPDAYAGLQQQLHQLHAQRLRTSVDTSGAAAVFKYEPGEFSPTSLAFYQQLGLDPAALPPAAGTSSAPGTQTAFQFIPQHAALPPHTAAPTVGSFLSAAAAGGGMHGRRRSVGEAGFAHPAAGAGTPGYGVEFAAPAGASSLAGRVRGVSAGMGHRRAAKSEDLGRGTGWGVGAGGSTADFLQSITNPDDGTLLPPSMRARSNSGSRHSSASSNRSPSPALSMSSGGSSYSPHMGHMDMPDVGGGSSKPVKARVTSLATEVASQSRRTNSGVFHCPIPGCSSTFTRHFNLKGHLRSHNDERPYKCLYDGCPKSIVGFARQHDCKRHMLLHEGLRPFECDGCGKKFARLDALTRHHKSEQGQECAISHPLPVNPDGSAMSESQYKAYKMAQEQAAGRGPGAGGVHDHGDAPADAGVTAGAPAGKSGRRSNGRARAPSWAAAGGGGGGGEDDAGAMEGMEEYDRA